MEPTTYCDRAIEELRGEPGGRHGGREGWQKIVVLSHLARLGLADRQFAGALRRLIERTGRAHQPNLAAAARAILGDWRTRSTSP